MLVGRYNRYQRERGSGFTTDEEIEKIKQGIYNFLGDLFPETSNDEIVDDRKPVLGILDQLVENGESLDVLIFAFIVKPIREKDIKSLDPRRLNKKDKKIVEKQEVVISKLFLPFLKFLCTRVVNPLDSASIERSLHGFYLFWSFIKKLYPETNFLINEDSTDEFVKMVRYYKANNSENTFDFSHQHFYLANFSDLKLHGDVFDNCYFYEVDFTSSQMHNASFIGTVFLSEEAYSDDSTHEEDYVDTGSFQEALIKDCDFSGVNAQGLNFSSARVINTTFKTKEDVFGAKKNSVLTSLSAAYSVWENCDFSDVDFSDSYFKKAKFRRVILSIDTNFFNVDFDSASLSFDTSSLDKAAIGNMLSTVGTLYRCEIPTEIKASILLNVKDIEQQYVNKKLFLLRENFDAIADRMEEEINEENYIDLFEDVDYLKEEEEITEKYYSAKEALYRLLNKKLEALSERVAFYSLSELPETELEIFVNSLIQELDSFKKRDSFR